MISFFFNRWLLIPVILLISYQLPAQQIEKKLGAVSMGTAYADIAEQRVWGVINNPASIVHLPSQWSTTVIHRHQLLELKTIGFACVFPIKQTSWGIGFSHFGDPLYQESQCYLNVGHQLGSVKLALRERFIHYSSEQYFSYWNYATDMGIIMPLHQKLLVGFYVNQMIVLGQYRENFTPEAYLGIAYHLSPKINTYLSVSNQLQYSGIEIQGGLEAKMTDLWTFTVGASSLKTISMGSHIYWKKFQIQYAVAVHEILPVTHQLSFGYVFNQSPSL